MSRAMRQVKDSELVADVETLNALAGLLHTRRTRLKLTKLFDTNASGWNNTLDFHSSCDNRGPTIVLIRSSDGKSYGGYTSVSWVSNGSYRQDPQAFLFRMCPESSQGSRRHIRTEKFPVSLSGQPHAQYSPSNYGPTFGVGNDLVTFTNGGISLSTSPHCYPTQGPLIDSSLPKTTANFQLEVLQVTVDLHGNGELEVPWLTDVAWAFKVHSLHCSLSQFPTLQQRGYVRLHGMQPDTWNNASHTLHAPQPSIQLDSCHFTAIQITLRCLCHVQDASRLQKEVFEFSPTAEDLPVQHINLLLCGGVGAASPAYYQP